MRTIKAIAGVTFKESLRNKIIINIFLFALFLFVLGAIVGNWSLGEKIKVITDFGLTGLHLVALLIAIFVGITLVSNEINSRSIYNTLSKQVSRAEFLAGKFAGLALTLLFNIFVIYLLLGLVLFLYSGNFFTGLWKPVILIYFEMLIIVAIAVLFSTFTNSSLAAIFTIFIYIAGTMLQSVMDYLNSITEGSLSGIVWLLKHIGHTLVWILPNLSLFDITTEFVYQTPVTSSYLGLVFLYFICYLGLVFTLSLIIFNRKDLK